MDREEIERRIRGVRRGVSAEVDPELKVTVRGESPDGKRQRIRFSKEAVEIWSPEAKKTIHEWASVAGGEVTQGILPGPLGHSLAQWFAETFNKSNPNDMYGRAIDSASHIGGPLYHHLVDGQHTLLGAIRAVRDVSPDDGLLRETYEAIKHLITDLFSVTGINPFFSLSPETLDSMAKALRPLGITKMYIADALTVNAVELLGAIAAFLHFAVGRDKMSSERTGELMGSMVTAAIASANPALLFVFGLQVFSMLRRGNTEFGQLAYHMGKGALVTGSVCLVSSAIAAAGLPVWVQIAGCFAAAIGVRYGIGKLEQTWPMLKRGFERTAGVMSEHLPALAKRALDAFFPVLALHKA